MLQPVVYEKHSLAVISKTHNAVNLVWEESGGVASYDVYHSINTSDLLSSPFETVYTNGSDLNPVTIRNLKPLTTYYFAVVAKNPAGADIYDYISVTTKPFPVLLSKRNSIIIAFTLFVIITILMFT